MAKTGADVIAHHVRASMMEDVNEIMRDYGKDSILIGGDKALNGPAEIRSYFASKPKTWMSRQSILDGNFVEKDVHYITWRELDGRRGASTYVVRDGKIAYHSRCHTTERAPRLGAADEVVQHHIHSSNRGSLDSIRQGYHADVLVLGAGPDPIRGWEELKKNFTCLPEGRVPLKVTVDKSSTEGEIHILWWHNPEDGRVVSETYIVKNRRIVMQTVFPISAGR